jgi:hypothetical protein
MQIAVGLGGFLIPVLMHLEDHHLERAAADEPAMAVE